MLRRVLPNEYAEEQGFWESRWLWYVPSSLIVLYILYIDRAMVTSFSETPAHTNMAY
jgi:hypothetical protein